MLRALCCPWVGAGRSILFFERFLFLVRSCQQGTLCMCAASVLPRLIWHRLVCVRVCDVLAYQTVLGRPAVNLHIYIFIYLYIYTSIERETKCRATACMMNALRNMYPGHDIFVESNHFVDAFVCFLFGDVLFGWLPLPPPPPSAEREMEGMLAGGFVMRVTCTLLCVGSICCLHSYGGVLIQMCRVFLFCPVSTVGT